MYNVCPVLKAQELTKNQHSRTTPKIHSMVSKNSAVSAQTQNVWQSLLFNKSLEICQINNPKHLFLLS